MREIKFRVWSDELKNWTSFECWVGEGFSMSDEDGFYIQQCIGLKDKNGREIYEGDILVGPNDKKLANEEKKLSGVHLEFWERAIVKWYNKYSRFVLEFYSQFGGEGYSGELDIGFFIKEGWVVIGNIFENPELLK